MGGLPLAMDFEFDKGPEAGHFGDLGGPGGPDNYSEKWSAKPPARGFAYHLSEGSPGDRGPPRPPT